MDIIYGVISDIDLLQARPLFKLGLIAHDYRRTVITSVLIICFSLGSLIVQLTPDWVEHLVKETWNQSMPLE